MENFILDSYSMITYFEKEKGYEKVSRFLYLASADKAKLLLNIVNWGEVFYIVLRTYGSDYADLIEKEINILPIKIIDLDFNLTRQAAVFKSKNKMSYADCFAAATAFIYKCSILTGDSEFKEVENEIKVEWI